MSTLVALVLVFVVALGSPVSADDVGTVHLATSCGAETQRAFDHAVAVLHSFWYARAAKEFTAITQTDPRCAMGFWGLAMSHWYPLWFPPTPAALQAGAAAVERAKAIAKTDREAAYVDAVAGFYEDASTVDHRSRALRYAAAMQRVHERYPDDSEAAVFYALALDATARPTDKTYANQRKAAEILEPIFDTQPNHPGVAHYLIHSYDYPSLADRGLPAARRYGQIAPAAPHALHMPSHIFTRLGLWRESIDSNRAAAAAARADGFLSEQLHSFDYITYASLQMAKDAEVREIVREAAAIAPRADNLAEAYALAAIPARFAVERNRWDEARALAVRSSPYAQSAAITVFARALGFARTGDPEAAGREVKALEGLRDQLTATGDRYWSGQVEIQREAAAAWAAHAAGDEAQAVRLMRAAADLEDSTDKHPVTPGQLLPARELLGDLLLAVGRSREGMMEFERSLKDAPNRFRSFAGAAQAAERAGDAARARIHRERLVALCPEAETERAELTEARAALARQ